MVDQVMVASIRLLLQRALAEKGEDFVYDLGDMGACEYTERDDDGRLVPSCLWGHVLVWSGVDVEELEKFEGTRVTDVPAPWSGDPVLILAAQASQLVQDTGNTWGQAVEAFENVVQRATL